MKETIPARIVMSLPEKQRKKLRWNNFFIWFSAFFLVFCFLINMKRFAPAFAICILVSLNHGRNLKKSRLRSVFISLEDMGEFFSLVFENIGTVEGEPCSLVHEISKQQPVQLSYKEKKEELTLNCIARSYYVAGSEVLSQTEAMVNKILFYTGEENASIVKRLLIPEN